MPDISLPQRVDFHPAGSFRPREGMNYGALRPPEGPLPEGVEALDVDQFVSEPYAAGLVTVADFATFVDRECERNRVTNAELARMLGIASSEAFRLRNGISHPDPHRLGKTFYVFDWEPPQVAVLPTRRKRGEPVALTVLPLEDRPALGHYLALAREARGRTPAVLAKAVGRSPDTLSTIETFGGVPRTMDPYFRTLGLQVGYLSLRRGGDPLSA